MTYSLHFKWNILTQVVLLSAETWYRQVPNLHLSYPLIEGELWPASTGAHPAQLG